MKLRNFRVDVSFMDSKAFRGTTYWHKYYNSHEAPSVALFSAFVYGVRNRDNAYNVVRKCHGSKIHRAGYTGASSDLFMKAVEVRKDGTEHGSKTPLKLVSFDPIVELPRKERPKVKVKARKTAKAVTQKGKARRTVVKGASAKAMKLKYKKVSKSKKGRKSKSRSR